MDSGAISRIDTTAANLGTDDVASDTDRDNVLPRDAWFDGWRGAASPKARALVADAIRGVEAYEALHRPRSRARRPADQLSFEATVAAVVCNAIHHHLSDRAGGIAVPRDKCKLARKSRYRSTTQGKVLPSVLDALGSREIGLIAMAMGHSQTIAEDGRKSPSRRTTIMASGLLRTRIAEAGLSFVDLSRDAHEEVILLRSEKRIGRGGRRQGELIEYDDTELTHRLRRAVATINTALVAANIELVGSECRHIDTTPSARRLHRVFNNGRFDHGGRYGGGWWINLPKAQRHIIRIDGQRVVTLDYRNMFARLAYARVGSEPPAGDLYDIPLFDGYRAGCKTLFNALLFDLKPRTKKPKGMADMLPKRPIRELIEAIAQAHPKLAPLFGTGVGYELMNLESNIITECMVRLAEHRISALPVHDALLASEHSGDVVRGTMKEVGRELCGVELPVDISE